MRLENKSVRQLENTLWDLCKKIIRKRHGNTCFTCGQSGLEAHNWHTGHYFPKGALGASMKYDLRILRPQCYNCNINYGGMGGAFRERLKGELGKVAEQKLFDECSSSKGKPIKARDWYIKLINDYKKLC